MRSSLPTPALRALARRAGALAVAVVLSAGLSACSFLTGVPNVSRVELTVVPTTTIAPGETVQAQGVPIGGGGQIITHSRRQIVYSTSNDSVITVTPTGLVLGVRTGRAFVIARSDDERAQVEITVRPVPVRQLEITPPSPIVRLAPSVTVPLTALAFDTAGKLVNRTAAWQSLDQGVATVSSVGLLSPRGVGTARIVASVDTGLAPRAGAVVDTIEVRVTPVPVVRVQVGPNPATVYGGQQQQFAATVIDSIQQTVTDRRVVWRSSNPAVLAVDSLTGLATAVSSSGSVYLRAEVPTVPGFPGLGVQRDSALVTVQAPAASVRVTTAGGAPVSGITLRAGASQALAFTALDAFGNQLPGRTFRVTSDTPAVVPNPPSSNPLPGNYTLTAGNTPGTASVTVQTLDAAGNPQGSPATFTVTVQP